MPDALQLLHEAVEGQDWDDAMLLRLACEFIDFHSLNADFNGWLNANLKEDEDAPL